MHAAALRAELRIPNVQSLKEKRRRLRYLDQHIRKAFPAVGVSEVDFQDQWQRTAIGIAAVAPSAGHVERLLTSVQRRLDELSDFELLGVNITHMERP
jgi:uncharacterized protein YlxP (DUF503 family)